MADNKPYPGPGKLSSALGTSSTYQIGGTVTGSVIGGTVAATVLKPDGKWLQYLAQRTSIPGLTKTSAVIGSTLLGGAVVGATAGIAGLFIGWSRAARARKAHDQLVNENESLKAQVDVLREVTKSDRGRWTDRVSQSRRGEISR